MTVVRRDCLGIELTAATKDADHVHVRLTKHVPLLYGGLEEFIFNFDRRTCEHELMDTDSELGGQTKKRRIDLIHLGANPCQHLHNLSSEPLIATDDLNLLALRLLDLAAVYGGLIAAHLGTVLGLHRDCRC